MTKEDDQKLGAAWAAGAEPCYYCGAEPAPGPEGTWTHNCPYAPDELTPEQRAKVFRMSWPQVDEADLVEAFKAAALTERYIVYDEHGILYGLGARQLTELVLGRRD